MHAIFHLLSAISAYNSFVIFSYLDIKRRAHTHKYLARIALFPRDKYFNFPYLVLTKGENEIDKLS